MSGLLLSAVYCQGKCHPWNYPNPTNTFDDQVLYHFHQPNTMLLQGYTAVVYPAIWWWPLGLVCLLVYLFIVINITINNTVVTIFSSYFLCNIFISRETQSRIVGSYRNMFNYVQKSWTVLLLRLLFQFCFSACLVGWFLETESLCYIALAVLEIAM